MDKIIKRPADILIAAASIAACCGARLFGLMPFGTPMYLAVCSHAFFGFIAPVYIACSFLFTFEVWRLYAAAAAVFIAAVRWLLALRFKKLNAEPVKIATALAAIAAHCAIIGVFDTPVNGILSFVIGTVFFFICRLSATCVMRRFAMRPSAADAAALGITLIVPGLALGGARIGEFTVGLSVAYFFILALCAVNAKAALAGGIAFGVGMALRLDGTVALALIGASAAAVAFRSLARPLYVLIGLGAFAAVEVLMSVKPIALGWDTLMCAVGGALFCLIPRRAVKYLREYFDYDGSARLAARYYINRTRNDAANKMYALASVFDETARMLGSFSQPKPDFAALGQSVSERFCPYCPNNGFCDEAARDAAFGALSELAYCERPIIAEMPEFFSSTCTRTAEVIAAASELSDRARDDKRRRESDMQAKTTVAERLVAVKDVLSELGAEQAQPVGFDGDAEERVAAELGLGGVECAEAFVTRNETVAIVRSAVADEKRLSRAVSVALKKPYAVKAIDRSAAAGWSVASLGARPKYEAVYARAGVSKSGGTSGDSYTFKRMDSKFLVALADGMGSGDRAGADSDAAIELIECFYRAGFDADSVLTGVNRFLKLPGSESYSAADVVVCDLESGNADIIKLGSPPCYIRTADTVLKIEGSSLPIGVLDEMRPYVTRKKLYPGQMLVLVTDGVSDCFDGDRLPEYINSLAALNPERVAKSILERALALSDGTPRDDMSVVAFRLFEVKKRKLNASHS